ncbi:MAG: co-chaperone GroES [Waddliaceae bacterium]|jgi:chaperonin GroES|nr:co-chaperone GroES [Waddliaceae bacterium]MBT3579041.1 co-chaperone GroES [Waddliaceae bacterium]MBT4445419.1 co-chaperone GroES [Waddliaceae bacterium]MBT6928818.1 co-chaperone GroES [Waddliaceae bacterium]MBT7263956.1 co-chaperone GroES [Waddliaceae bacterium]
MSKKLRPLSDRVLLKRLESQETMKGGIILPDSAKEQQETAEVVAMGPGRKDKNGAIIAMPVSIGDKVLTDKYSSQEIVIDDEKYIIVRADDIIAIVE